MVKQVPFKKSTKAARARAERGSRKGKGKGKAPKVKGALAKSGEAKALGKVRNDGRAGELNNETSVVKDASKAPKMKLKRKLTDEERKALQAKKGKMYWELYKEMRKQFDQDKEKFDPMVALGKRAKALWEIVRNENTPVDERTKKIHELHRLIRGRASKMINARDLSRVIECLMQHGDVEVRAGLFEELKKEIPELTKSVFAHFFVLKVLKYGSKDQREYVLSSFRGSVPELMNHKVASGVVETAYNDWANATQRGLLQQEFYSPSYVQFKDSSITSLEKALAVDGADKEKILEHMREKLEPIIDKGLIQHNLIQTLLLEYLTHCGENARKDMIDNIKENLIHMIHTREGARVAMHCIWNTNAKDRKVIMKSWKTYVARIAKEEHGYLTLLALFDSVDDTKALDKMILRELMTEVHDVALNEVGRKVVLYLVAPRDTKFTHPDVIRILSQGDSNPNSKKAMDVRQKEVRSAVARDLVSEVCSNGKRYMADNAAVVVARAVLQLCSDAGDFDQLLGRLHKDVAELMAVPFKPAPPPPKKTEEDRKKRGKKRKSSAILAMDSVLPDFMRDLKQEQADREKDLEARMHVIERPATHMLIKHLLKLDVGKGAFCAEILEAVGREEIRRWVECNRGCFILVNMLDTKVDSIRNKIKSWLKASPALSTPACEGARVLKAKLEGPKP